MIDNNFVNIVCHQKENHLYRSNISGWDLAYWGSSDTQGFLVVLIKSQPWELSYKIFSRRNTFFLNLALFGRFFQLEKKLTSK